MNKLHPIILEWEGWSMTDALALVPADDVDAYMWQDLPNMLVKCGVRIDDMRIRPDSTTMVLNSQKCYVTYVLDSDVSKMSYKVLQNDGMEKARKSKNNPYRASRQRVITLYDDLNDIDVLAKLIAKATADESKDDFDITIYGQLDDTVYDVTTADKLPLVIAKQLEARKLAEYYVEIIKQQSENAVGLAQDGLERRESWSLSKTAYDMRGVVEHDAELAGKLEEFEIWDHFLVTSNDCVGQEIEKSEDKICLIKLLAEIRRTFPLEHHVYSDICKQYGLTIKDFDNALAVVKKIEERMKEADEKAAKLKAKAKAKAKAKKKKDN